MRTEISSQLFFRVIGKMWQYTDVTELLDRVIIDYRGAFGLPTRMLKRRCDMALDCQTLASKPHQNEVLRLINRNTAGGCVSPVQATPCPNEDTGIGK